MATVLSNEIQRRLHKGVQKQVLPILTLILSKLLKKHTEFSKQEQEQRFQVMVHHQLEIRMAVMVFNSPARANLKVTKTIIEELLYLHLKICGY